MDWNNATVVKFLQLYRDEPIIWDTKHPANKNKIKVHNAWSRIGSSLNMSVLELKNKKNSLMATYRSHRRRKLASIQSGVGEEDIYQPIWFAYQMMDDFLGPVYECKSALNIEDSDSALTPHHEEQETTAYQNQAPGPGHYEVKYEQYDQYESPDDQYEVVTPHIEPIHHNDTSAKSRPAEAVVPDKSDLTERQKRRKLTHEIDDAQEKIQTTFNTLSNTLSSVLTKKKEEEDECGLYVKLLAKKLREYPVNERRHLMHEIDGLFLNRPPTSPYS